MRVTISQQFVRGFSLIETLFSLTMIAVILPTLFTAFSLSLGSKQRIRSESRAIEIAQTVFTQIPFAWRTRPSYLFPSEQGEEFPSLSLTEGSGILITAEGALYDSDEQLIMGDKDWLISDPSMAQSPRNGYVALLSSQSLDANSEERLLKVTLEVQYPAGRPATARRSYVYTRVFRKE